MIDWKLAPEGAETLRQSEDGFLFFDRNNNWWDFISGSWTDFAWSIDCSEEEKISTRGRYKTIATRPTQKTVADAVEALKDRNPCINYDYIAVCKIAHSDWLKVGDFEFVGKGYDKEIFDIVCTRAEFESYVKEQEGETGETWTHTRELDGERCYLLSDKADKDGHLPVFVENVGYDVEFGFRLKPIKPTMTEDQQKMVAKFIARVWSKNNPDLRAEFDEFCNEHDIT